MEKRAGVFIVIEGADGSGKSTQFGLLRERLEEAGHEVSVFKFPRYEHPASYFVRRYLEGGYGNADDVGPYTTSLFYALDRFEAAPEIRQALREGKVVLCDRFSGSNMAHQGTKIANAEQRRGFFIWLDNLEFEMLRIPRPDISFVLRMPASLSQKLAAARQEKDIHETDFSHQERTVAVFDEMTQLFPKDFQRIDCVRGGQLLDVENVASMLWEKVNPLLPAPPPKTRSAKTSSNNEPRQTAVQQTPDESNRLEPQTTLTLNGVSSIITQHVERLCATASLEYTDIPEVYEPANLVPAAAKEYSSKTNALLGLYAKLVAGLAKHGISKAEAEQSARFVLPVATAANVHLDVNDPKLEELIIGLINSPLPEAQTAGSNLFAQAVKASSIHFRNASQPVKRAAPATIKNMAEEFLNENHIGEQPAVQLTTVWPRNEADLVADMLYEHSNLPLRTIQERVNSWPMSRKLSVLEAYMTDPHPGQALEKARYSWDLQAPYSVFRELQRQPSEALAIQPLTPRYGFDVPKLIEEAGLSDTYEKCFDLSLELYSALQKSGHMQEAQYATLYGHSQRWQMTQNGVQALNLMKRSDLSPEALELLENMHEKLSEHHPAIGETVSQNA